MPPVDRRGAFVVFRAEPENDERPGRWPGRCKSLEKFGGDLLSQGISPQVPSALAGLTAVFGMGTGVTPPPWPPKPVVNGRARMCAAP